jgi:2-methylaconitate cis-trans-isomerase PrpF
MVKIFAIYNRHLFRHANQEPRLFRNDEAMDDLVRIPCVLMRGGTSRGPFFLASHLPQDRAARDAVLIEAMGSGHFLQIDGIGGGNPLTSKVAIVGPASRPEADVDYLFAQVDVMGRSVDTSPNCGNMLAGVGPFAIEAGLVRPQAERTTVRIHNVNTGALVAAQVSTPGGRVAYGGDASIDGVPGTAAPVLLGFEDVVGLRTGRLIPTETPIVSLHGVDVTLIDSAMPLVVARAEDFGFVGTETPEQLDRETDFKRKLELVRRAAGVALGFGRVDDLVVPKPVLVARPGAGGHLAARYFMPHVCHTAIATTGAVGLALAASVRGTIVNEITGDIAPPVVIVIEHPSGRIEVTLEQQAGAEKPTAYIVRTARRLFEGSVLVRGIGDRPTTAI